MIIKKRIDGHDIILVYELVENYPNGFSRFNVYKYINMHEKKFLYTTCLSDMQLNKIICNKFRIDEEVFE